jgi:Peptidase propeptide and YPEB domain
MSRQLYIKTSICISVIVLSGIVANDVFSDECEYRYPAERISVIDIERYVDKANYKIVLMRSKFNRCYEFVVTDRSKRLFEMKLDQKTGRLIKITEIKGG